MLLYETGFEWCLQIPLNEESQKLTTINYPEGLSHILELPP